MICPKCGKVLFRTWKNEYICSPDCGTVYTEKDGETMRKVGTITDQTGHTIEIVDSESYTVIYYEDGNMKVQQGCYHNFPADQYIGKDDEEGCSHGARVYFNGTCDDRGVIPFVVLTDKQFAAKMKKVFNI